jgi:hypothetical protein
VLDVENIRLHYALTLRHWLERYEAAIDQVRAMFDETFVRMWRLYLAGSVAAFESGTLQLFQVSFATRGNNDIPLTRQHLLRLIRCGGVIVVGGRPPVLRPPGSSRRASCPVLDRRPSAIEVMRRWITPGWCANFSRYRRYPHRFLASAVCTSIWKVTCRRRAATLDPPL